MTSTEVAPKDVTAASTKAKTPFGKFPYMVAGGAAIYNGASMLEYIGSLRKDLNLNGANVAEAAIVSQWMQTALVDFEAHFNLLQGGAYGDKIVAMKKIVDFFKIVDNHYVYHTFTAGNTFTVADILIAVTLVPAFTTFFGPVVQEMLPSLTRFFLTVVNQPNVAAIVGKVELSTKDSYIEAPKPLPTEEDKPKKAEKVVNPIDELPKSTMKIDDVKRIWSMARPYNPEFFTGAEGFWTYFDKEGWSLYAVDYKYPEDWDKDYVADNQLVGFINRSEAVKKYGFAVMNLFKQADGNFNAKGAWILRGKEEGFALLDESAAENEEYNFVKLNPDSEEDRKKFENLLCAETIDGQDIIFRRALK